uniref:Putative secreted protein n=1 Tax=Anopheles marajoara TaxID=58244 RepID=A0A2M4CDW6_9DIPT
MCQVFCYTISVRVFLRVGWFSASAFEERSRCLAPGSASHHFGSKREEQPGLGCTFQVTHPSAAPAGAAVCN